MLDYNINDLCRSKGKAKSTVLQNRDTERSLMFMFGDLRKVTGVRTALYHCSSGPFTQNHQKTKRSVLWAKLTVKIEQNITFLS